MNADVNRREFVKIGAAGAAMAALPGILRAQQAPGLAAGKYYRANETVRVACVGYSDRFRSSLLPCFLHHNKELKFDMVAVADLWKKRLFEKAKPEIEKKIGHKIDAYSSDMALYEQAKDVDAVIISTADFQHAQHACHAVVAGKGDYSAAFSQAFDAALVSALRDLKEQPPPQSLEPTPKGEQK